MYKRMQNEKQKEIKKKKQRRKRNKRKENKKTKEKTKKIGSGRLQQIAILLLTSYYKRVQWLTSSVLNLATRARILGCALNSLKARKSRRACHGHQPNNSLPRPQAQHDCYVSTISIPLAGWTIQLGQSLPLLVVAVGSLDRLCSFISFSVFFVFFFIFCMFFQQFSPFLFLFHHYTLVFFVCSQFFLFFFLSSQQFGLLFVCLFSSLLFLLLLLFLCRFHQVFLHMFIFYQHSMYIFRAHMKHISDIRWPFFKYKICCPF